jgi:hypothetical protein
MNRFGTPSEDHQPVTWLRGYPVYATHLIVLVYVASMLVTTVLMNRQMYAVSGWLMFDTDAIFKGQVWRYLTYGLWNPPSLWFAVDMLLLIWFGREVEKFFGRGTFLRFYAALYLLTPLLFTLVGIWRPMRLAGETGSFAVFIAFATLYPGAMMMFNVLAKWAAIVLTAIYTLIAIAGRDLVGLLSLWTTVTFAYGFVRYHQGYLTLPQVPRWRRRPHLRVLPNADAPPASGANAARGGMMAEVDALLDKIARSGISSLTAKERAKLDRAREDLKNRGSRRS